MKIFIPFLGCVLLLFSCSEPKENNEQVVSSLITLAKQLDTTKSIKGMLVLQPTLAECKAVFKTEEDALNVYNHLEKEYKMASEQMTMNPIKGRFPNGEIVIADIPTDTTVNQYLVKYEPLVSKLNNYTLYQIQYHNHAEKFNMRFDAFVFVNSKWKYFGELTRVFN